MNLHDWIDELCDALDVETEVDEGLLNDLAAIVRDAVEPAAAAVTAYLVGLAAGVEASLTTVEQLAAKAQALAESWDRPADAGDDEDDVEPIDDLEVTDVDDDEEAV